MNAGLLVAYIALWLAFIGLIIGALAVKSHRKTLISLIVAAGVLIIALTYLICEPLLMAVKEGITMPKGIVLDEVTKDEEKKSDDKAWGPQDRTLYKTDDPIDQATFNSIINNPNLGHETNFVRIREAGIGTYTDNVNIKAGKEYEVFVYYHNDGNATARDVRIKIDFPTKLEDGMVGALKGIINAANTESVFDTAYMHTDSTVYPTYVPDSAALHYSGSANGMILDSEDLFSIGAEIGYDQDKIGDIPGGIEGYLIFRFKVDQPGWFTTSEVSAEGNDWKEIISAKTGDVLRFRIRYKNTGTTWQTSVTVHDNLGRGLELIPGTVTVQNGEGTYKVSDSIIEDGLNIGDYSPGQTAEGFH